MPLCTVAIASEPLILLLLLLLPDRETKFKAIQKPVH